MAVLKPASLGSRPPLILLLELLKPPSCLDLVSNSLIPSGMFVFISSCLDESQGLQFELVCLVFVEYFLYSVVHELSENLAASTSRSF